VLLVGADDQTFSLSLHSASLFFNSTNPVQCASHPDNQILGCTNQIEKTRTVRIVEALTKEHAKTPLWAHLRTVQRVETNQATISREEEVGIGTGQTGEGVERSTVYRHKDGRGEMRLREEFDPVDIVVI
jgi:hypothetical protein